MHTRVLLASPAPWMVKVWVPMLMPVLPSMVTVFPSATLRVWLSPTVMAPRSVRVMSYVTLMVAGVVFSSAVLSASAVVMSFVLGFSIPAMFTVMNGMSQPVSPSASV